MGLVIPGLFADHDTTRGEPASGSGWRRLGRDTGEDTSTQPPVGEFLAPSRRRVRVGRRIPDLIEEVDTPELAS